MLDPPTAGKYELLGEDVRKNGSRVAKGKCRMCFQKLRSDRDQRIKAMLEKFDMVYQFGHYPLVISRIVVNRPKIIVAHEATENSNSKRSNEALKLVVSRDRQSSTIAMVAHSRVYAGFAHRKNSRDKIHA